MFLMLFKNRSTSSAGCPEKLGRSSKRAFQAFANNVWSAVILGFVSIVVAVVMKLGCEAERGIRRECNSVRTVCGMRSLLFFLTFDRVPEAVANASWMSVVWIMC